MKRKYIPISVLSFVLLLGVQYMLIYNTFYLRNTQYNVKSKRILDSVYSHLIFNDKVYPGGQAIIDSSIIPHYAEIERLSTTDTALFNRYLENLCENIIAELRKKSPMDSIFKKILSENNINPDMQYALYLHDLQVTLDGKHYIDLLAHKDLGKNSNLRVPIWIDGDLNELNNQNLISRIGVSSTQRNSYKTNFSLYADDISSRYRTVLSQMTPTLSLSFITILTVVSLYYLTYRNWIRQKKVTQMSSDFLNSITHEFNTPITTISIANKSLANMEQPFEESIKKELTDVISRQTARLHKLVKQALNITSLNKYDLTKDEYVLESLLYELIKDYRLAHSEDVQINLVESKDTPTISVSLNKFLFITAMYNILDNAIKYNQADTKILDIKMIIRKNKVAVYIKDNGVGIDEIQKKKAFNKFYKGSEDSKYPGLGLGLYYVKKVADAHGWVVDIESQIGQGTTVYIWIETSLT